LVLFFKKERSFLKERTKELLRVRPRGSLRLSAAINKPLIGRGLYHSFIR
jgi:hypothetical protein